MHGGHMTGHVDLNLDPFQLVTLSPLEGQLQTVASVKLKGTLYFLSFAVKAGDGGPTLSPFSSRVETRQGKGVRGKNNVELEQLMDSLRESVLQAVRTTPSLLSHLSS
jgi:hypothetical protein